MIIVKIPSSMGALGKNQESRKAPDVIVGKLKGNGKKLKVEEAEVIPFNVEETNKNIYATAKKLMNDNCVFLGGDHSITYSLFKAFSELYSNSALIIFDAHTDCTKRFLPPSHGDFLRTAIEEGFVKGKNVLLVGTMGLSENEGKYIKRKRINRIPKNKIKEEFEESKNGLWNFIEKVQHVYLSIDIDVFDMKLAPGSGVLTPNGLNKKEFMGLFELLLNSGKIRALDLVEVNPAKDKGGKTVKLAAEIIEKAFGVVA